MSLPGVRYVVDSDNAKIGRCDAVYLSTSKSCPSSCPLKNNGCYAEDAYVGMLNTKLNAEAKNLDSTKVAMNEAKAIRASYNGGHIPNKDLRLHVSGDCRTEKAVTIVLEAIVDWKNRGGGSVWSYTHSWKTISRDTWGVISCLGSIEKEEDIEKVRAQGYTPAMVVSHKENHGKNFVKSGIRFIVCPAQVQENMTCDKCRLCFDDRKLYAKKLGIAFLSHGPRKNKILNVLQ